MNTPAEVAKNYIETGAAKTKMKASKLAVLAIFAGMFIALAGVGSAAATSTITNSSLAKLISALVFPTGLAMVLIAGSELFTGNTLIIISVIEKKAALSGMLKNWIIVYIGNFIGSILIALLVVYSHIPSMYGNGMAESIVYAATNKVSLTFADAFLRGILCNFLVCIAVWMAYSAKTVVCKVAALYLPIMLFVVSGYEHSIANMYYISVGIFASAEYNIVAEGLNWGSFFVKNLIPVTLGNIIGGGLLVGVGYWSVYLRDVKEPKKSK